MFSELKPHFEKIERYFYEINVSLRVEEEYLEKISRSLRVTPGDKVRWENIRDACGAASTLLTPGVGSTSAPVTVPSRLQLANQTQPLPNVMPQQTVSTSVVHPVAVWNIDLYFPFSQSNKAARYIRALAQTVTDARQSLLQTPQDIVGHPKSSLWRLRDVYENSQVACRQKIEEVHGFSEDFLRSFVEVPPLDDFHVYHLPSAAAESSHILRHVHKQVQSTRRAPLQRFSTYLLTFEIYPYQSTPCCTPSRSSADISQVSSAVSPSPMRRCSVCTLLSRGLSYPCNNQTTVVKACSAR